MREFVDERGTRWLAYAVGAGAAAETSRHYLPGAYQAGWLVFDSGTRKLRLAPIPAGWADLADHALRELLLAAEPTTPTTPRGQRAYGAPPEPNAPRAGGA